MKKLFMEIANEEKVHIGEFEFALEHVDPEHDKYEDKGEDEAEELLGWEEKEDEDEEETEENQRITEDASDRKKKIKDIQQANKMRCKSILNQINRRREDIKALLLQGRQWGCGE